MFRPLFPVSMKCLVIATPHLEYGRRHKHAPTHHIHTAVAILIAKICEILLIELSDIHGPFRCKKLTLRTSKKMIEPNDASHALHKLNDILISISHLHGLSIGAATLHFEHVHIIQKTMLYRTRTAVKQFESLKTIWIAKCNLLILVVGNWKYIGYPWTPLKC